MAKRREPSVLHQLVGPEWFTTTVDTEAGNNQEDMKVFINQLLVQAEIPELPTPPAEMPAVTESLQASPRQFVQASDQDLQRLRNKNTNKNTLKSTNTWVRRFEGWRKARGIDHELLTDKCC